MAEVQALAIAAEFPRLSGSIKEPPHVQVVALGSEEAEDKESQYSKLPLPEDSPHIRLVTLKPGPWSADIECDMTVVRLGGAKSPSYETISYVWGDPTIQHPIRLNGYEFNVTENLWLALRRLRRPSEPRVMWIDAICINQEDDNEKSDQVGMMGDIYRGCQKCTIWLGEDTMGTGKLASELFGMFASGKCLSKMECFSKGKLLGTSQKYMEHMEAGMRVFELPWWQRVWVIQELSLPPMVEFIYGSECFPYPMILKMTEELTAHCSKKCCKTDAVSLAGDLAFEVLLLAGTQAGPMILAREDLTKEDADLDLFKLRKRFYSRQATEKRDLFYGLLSLVTKWSSTEGLQPNYAIPLREAVTEAAFACVLEGGMDFLVGERAQSMSDGMFSTSDLEKIAVIPSWIPNTCFLQIPVRQAAAEASRLYKYSWFKASGKYKQQESELTVRKDGVLFAQTLAVNKIERVGPICEFAEYNIGKAMLAGREWMNMAGVDFWNWPSQMPPEGDPLNKFWRTVLYDLVMENTTADSYRRLNANDYTEHQKLWSLLRPLVSASVSWIFDLVPSVISFLSYLPNIGKSLGDRFGISIPSPETIASWVVEAPETIMHLGVCMWDQRMYITDSGVIGLAPAGTKTGDEVHIVLGAAAPFVFRRDGEVENAKGGSETESCPSYKIVGNCFQLNIMDGQALENGGLDAIKTVAIQ